MSIKKTSMNFKTMAERDVPKGRRGKHREIISQILSDLDQTKPGSAIKLPLKELAESKERVRSALNRVTRRDGRNVATASDENYLYIWNVQTQPH
jgi:hypothetical protein